MYKIGHKLKYHMIALNFFENQQKECKSIQKSLLESKEKHEINIL